MNTHFFYTKDGENFGPFSIEQLKKEGITPETLVWHAQLTDWTVASEVEELNELFKRADSNSNTVPPPPKSSGEQYKNNQTPPPHHNMYPPNNYLVGAILVTVFCCMPFGIVSIVHASRVENRFYMGDYAGAIESSRQARRWLNAAWISSLVLWVAYIFFYIFIFVGLWGMTVESFTNTI